jgi:TRAP-type mannitol/chloroaromatic compound transport system permease small subunit
MPKLFISYVKFIDNITSITGKITMYTVFLMMGILVLSFVTRNIINLPLIWIIEMAQFIMTGYYLMGGAYSMLDDQHVRMDLVYGNFSEKNKARMDLFTSVFLLFYLVVLLIGSYNSLIYTLETNKRLFTAWAPYVWPISSIMFLGISLMLLQTISTMFKDYAKVKGLKI